MIDTRDSRTELLAVVILICGAIGAVLLWRISPWMLLPFAFLAALALLRIVKASPHWLRSAVRAIILRGLYASLFLSALILLVALFDNVVTPVWFWNAERYIFDHRDVLEDATLLRPSVILPIILGCGLVSFLRRDSRPISLLRRSLSMIGNLSLLLYTVSLFTLFTVEVTRYQVDQVQTELIAKYRFDFDLHKKAVGRYLAAQSIKDFVDNDAASRANFTELLSSIAKCRAAADMTVLAAAAAQGANLTSPCVAPTSLRGPAPPSVRRALVDMAITRLLSEIVPRTADGGSNGINDAEFERWIVVDFEKAESELSTSEISARTDALHQTILAALGTSLGLVPGLDRYIHDALDEVLGQFAERVVIPALDRTGAALRNILEARDIVASEFEALQAIFPSDGDASNSGAARFEKLIAGHLDAPTPVPTRSFGEERATGLRAILDDRIHVAGRPGDKVK